MLNQAMQDDVAARRAQLTPELYEYLTITQLTELGCKHHPQTLYNRIYNNGMTRYAAATTPKMRPKRTIKIIDESMLKTPADYDRLSKTDLTRIGLRHKIGTIESRLNSGMTKYQAATTPKKRPGRSPDISAHVQAWKKLSNAMSESALANKSQSIFPFDKNATPERRLAAMRWSHATN